MLYVHLTDLDRDLVSLQQPFVQRNAWGEDRLLSYCAKTHANFDELTLVEVCEIAKKHPVEHPAEVPAPAGGGGRYLPVSDEAVSALRALNETREDYKRTFFSLQRTAVEVLRSMPTGDAAKELREINAGYARMANAINEGGEGYVPHLSWASDTGRQILARHGIDSDLVAAATRLACSEHFTADGKMAMEEFSAQAALAGYALPAVPSFEPSGPELTNTPPSVT